MSHGQKLSVQNPKRQGFYWILCGKKEVLLRCQSSHDHNNLRSLFVEFLITPASIADITALKAKQIDVRFGAVLYGDKAYTDYSFEDMLRDSMDVRLIPERKSCLRRQHSGPLGYLSKCV